ncbi:hypothetical protein HaLaN_26342, partial [Haematococcus lacustris]
MDHLAAASSAGTSLEANLKHITVTLATWDMVYLDPKQYGAQDWALEQFFKKLEDMAEVSMERLGHAKQLAGSPQQGSFTTASCTQPGASSVTN